MRRLSAILALAVLAAAPPAVAAAGVLHVTPKHVHYGKTAFDTSRSRTITITNTGATPVLVDVDTVVAPDDFAAGQPESTCPLPEDTLLAPGASCTHVAEFQPDRFFSGLRKAVLVVRAKDPETGAVVDRQRVRLTGRGVEPSP
jgi:hypothetical protein